MSRVDCLNDPGDASSHMGCVDATGTCEGPGRLEKGRQLEETSYFILNNLLIFLFVTGWFMHILTLKFVVRVEY